MLENLRVPSLLCLIENVDFMNSFEAALEILILYKFYVIFIVSFTLPRCFEHGDAIAR